MVIGGVPLAVQSTVTLYPTKTLTGLPILTLLFPFVVSGSLSCGPSSISGGSPKEIETIHVHSLYMCTYLYPAMIFKFFVCLNY